MATKIVSHNEKDKSALVAGMSWHPLISDVKNRPKEIRELLASSEAKKIATITSHSNTMIGLYAPDDDIETENGTKPVKLYSLALAFASFVGDGNAVLAYTLPGSSLSAIVLVEGGRPLIDDVKSSDDVQNLASNYANGSTGFTYQLYTNDPGMFSSGEAIDEATLWSGASKASLLQGLPVNYGALFTLVLVVAIGLGGMYTYKEYSKKQERLRMIAEQKANDPVRKYEDELMAQLPSLGTDSKTVLNVIKELGAQPLRQAGWSLETVDCFASTGQCISHWKRAGGTTPELIAARKPFGEEIQGDSSVDQTNFLLKVAMPKVGIPSKESLPTAAESSLVATPIYQVLSNAGVQLMASGDGYKSWPNVPGLAMAQVPQTISVKQRGVEFTTSIPLAEQALMNLPTNFWWTELHIKTEESSKDVIQAISISLKGNSYVR